MSLNGYILMKLCVNCKFYEERKVPTCVKGINKTEHLCWKGGQYVSPITGLVLQNSPKDCQIERGATFGDCGINATYFQEKTKKPRWWNW